MATNKDFLTKKHTIADKTTCHASQHEDLWGYLCGDFVEIVYLPFKRPEDMKEPSARTPAQKTQDSEESVRTSLSRTRKNIRQLCNTNGLWILHTLTYAIEHPKYFEGEKPFVLRDVDHTKNRNLVIEDWKRFARKMRAFERKHGEEFLYLAVIERHTGKRAKDSSIKQGTYHVHFVSNKPYSKRLLQAKWTHGLCNYSDWRKGTFKNDLDEMPTGSPVDNPGAYMSKYIGKDGDEVECSKKRYWRATYLDAPTRIDSEGLCKMLANDTYTNIYSGVTTFESEGKEFKVFRSTLYIHDRKRMSIETRKPKTRRARIDRKAIIREIQYTAHMRAKEASKEKGNYARPTKKRHSDDRAFSFEKQIDFCLAKKWRFEQEKQTAIADW